MFNSFATMAEETENKGMFLQEILEFYDGYERGERKATRFWNAQELCCGVILSGVQISEVAYFTYAIANDPKSFGLVVPAALFYVCIEAAKRKIYHVADEERRFINDNRESMRKAVVEDLSDAGSTNPELDILPNYRKRKL